MSDLLLEELQAEIERIKLLPLEEQVVAFAALREKLEGVLDATDGN